MSSLRLGQILLVFLITIFGSQSILLPLHNFQHVVQNEQVAKKNLHGQIDNLCDLCHAYRTSSATPSAQPEIKFISVQVALVEAARKSPSAVSAIALPGARAPPLFI